MVNHLLSFETYDRFKITRESQIVVLEVQTDARKVYNGLYADFLQLLFVANTTSLKNQW